jgi:transposase
MTLRVRDLHAGEAEELMRMTRSRTLGAGLVRRAQIVQHAVEGRSPPEIAARLDVCKASVRFWLKRFNARGLPGLKEEMRSGRPPTYTPEERSAVITAALSRPTDLDLPFAGWTLDRLVAHLSEKGIGMKRSRISEILLAEGLKWRQEETWFGARVDPDFARKRGLSSTSTPPRLTTVLSSVLTKWGRRPARAIPAEASSSRPGREPNGPNRTSTMAGAT